MIRKRVVAVIGSGTINENNPSYSLAMDIGKAIVDRGMRVLTGGLGGVMEAAMKGGRASKNYTEGDTIGILPGLDHSDANDFADIVIPTGLGIARNMIVTNADGVIAVGGGSGTLSEMAFSWQKGRPIVALKVPGWSGELAGKRIDEKGRYSRIIPAEDPGEAVDSLVLLMRDKDI